MQVTSASVQIGKRYRVERTHHTGTQIATEGVVTHNDDEYLTFQGSFVVDVHPTVVFPQIYIYEVD